VTPTATEPGSVYAWAALAKRGDVFEYYRGDLAYARYLKQAQKEMTAEELADLENAADAWALYQKRDVTLIQRREGVSVFAYLAVRL
jgi:hypothetical protein